ncbi:hypothetical protein SK803_12345 [Lentzea sp. BCCO 10_0856]|uniref:Uncharacterized protein n=1 Tax=Lentzea miocenica TaxID=3095431 RepID=A0ABU4SYL5_9PSEU|nr:hypothetical protein [Lentzea sp. BCCO 10_0856]MDX8031010.1 hypothetical protein [Lentzea sp. BCCO 10_0856]
MMVIKVGDVVGDGSDAVLRVERVELVVRVVAIGPPSAAFVAVVDKNGDAPRTSR